MRANVQRDYPLIALPIKGLVFLPFGETRFMPQGIQAFNYRAHLFLELIIQV